MTLRTRAAISTLWVLGLGIWVVGVAAAQAAERYAVIVAGVSGGEKYAAQHKQWREEIVSFLTAGLDVPDANLVVLEAEREGSASSTAANIRRVMGDLRRRLVPADTLMLVLLGHGTFDGIDAKFNLVGPDLTAAEWKGLLEGLQGRVVVVNTTQSSFPFLEQLSAPGRVVITATDSAAQRFATVFPEYFIRSLVDQSSDADKNGRVSILEAFNAASAGVKQHYEQRGQLSTERPLIDDDGDGSGREAGAPGPDGTLAGTIYLDREPGTEAGGDVELAALQRQRLVLEARLQALRERKSSIPEDDYQAELEKLLIELARVGQAIRQRS